MLAAALVLGFSLAAATPVVAAVTLTVNTALPNVPPNYWTIQAAVNAANTAGGDTIIVAAGTYDEQVVIDRSLTLQGAGDATVIRPSSAAKLTTLLPGIYTGCAAKFVAAIIGAFGSWLAPDTPVTIRNLKVDESLVTTKPIGADVLTGILYSHAGGLVDTVTVAGTGAWSNWDRAYGMCLSCDGPAVSVEVKGSSISNWDKNAIEVMGPGLTANIHDNILTGRGPLPNTDEVQNGVNVGCFATATVNDNTITDLSWTNQQWWSAGILFGDAKPGTANGNTIKDCQIGIIFDNTSGSAQGNTIDGGAVGLVGLWAQYYLGPLGLGPATVSFVDNGVCAANDDTFYPLQNAAIGVQNWDPTLPVIATIDHNRLTAKAATSADGILIGDPAGAPANTIVATITRNIIRGWQNGIRLDAGADDLNSKANFNDMANNLPFGVANNVGANWFDAMSNWWGDPSGPGGPWGVGIGDPVTNMVNFAGWLPGPCVTASVTPTAGPAGEAYFFSNEGNVIDLTAVPPPAPPPPTITLPYGMFEFKICCMTGATATLIVTLPGPVPVGTKWWKYHNNTWSSIDIGDDDGDDTITVALTDGASPDDEDLITGQITDQGAPGYPGAVGWETYPVSKVRVLLPWIALLAAIMAGVSLLGLRRRRTQT
jgi:hypothetical protein